MPLAAVGTFTVGPGVVTGLYCFLACVLQAKQDKREEEEAAARAARAARAASAASVDSKAGNNNSPDWQHVNRSRPHLPDARQHREVTLLRENAVSAAALAVAPAAAARVLAPAAAAVAVPAVSPTAAAGSDKDERLLGCVVCFDRECTHALVPCGHRCVCEACSTQLLGAKDAARPEEDGGGAEQREEVDAAFCPICRRRCESALRVFI